MLVKEILCFVIHLLSKIWEFSGKIHSAFLCIGTTRAGQHATVVNMARENGRGVGQMIKLLEQKSNFSWCDILKGCIRYSPV